jgi:hypothetical protein
MKGMDNGVPVHDMAAHLVNRMHQMTGKTFKVYWGPGKHGNEPGYRVCRVQGPRKKRKNGRTPPEVPYHEPACLTTQTWREVGIYSRDVALKDLDEDLQWHWDHVLDFLKDENIG